MIVRDKTGQVFGRLTVIRFLDRNGSGVPRWLCRCVCGNEKVASSEMLTKGYTQSCGCLKRERVIEAHTKHGLCRSHPKEYRAWYSMVDRCLNHECANYKNYGARGIQVCERWLQIENFIADVGPSPSRRHSLERINNNGNYEPGNVRWATPKEQAVNRRTNVFLTFHGETLCLTDWARRFGMKKTALSLRIRKGWPVEIALTTPISKANRNIFSTSTPLEAGK